MTAIDNDVIVEGQRVRLRRKRLSDAPNDYAWRRDADLARYDATRPTSLSYDDFLANYTGELLHPQPFRCTFALEDRLGHHIGNVMYYNIDLRRRETELGITIGNAAYWGCGFGTEAVTLLVDYVFTETSLTRIYLHTLDWNARAQRTFVNVGFRDCGRTQRGEHRFRVMELRREWLWQRDYSRRSLHRRS
ncbi:MAG: GNAT family N-acetyltransferase [Dehalococcoidia bacterium]